MSDDELPELSSLILRPTTRPAKPPLSIPTNAPPLRRSPRKQNPTSTTATANISMNNVPHLLATSQQRMMPRKQPSPRRAPLKATHANTRNPVLESVPELAPLAQKATQRTKPRAIEVVSLLEDDSADELAAMLQPLSRLSLRPSGEALGSEKENIGISGSRGKKTQPTSTMTKITQAARSKTGTGVRGARTAVPKRSNPYILKEAHCEDLNQSSGTDGEDEVTDLSGFVVDDAAEISFHGSEGEQVSEDSGEERRTRRQQRKEPEMSPRRRLVRGRKKQVVDSDEDEDGALSKALDGMNLGQPALEEQRNADRRKTVEVIDLTSSPVQRTVTPVQEDLSSSESEGDKQEDARQVLADPLSGLNNALKLQPSGMTQPQLLPSKMGPLTTSPKRLRKPAKQEETARPTTPTTTPPRSPTKLKSPTKLLSPSKRAAQAPRSPHRQSMDAFWDHHVINEWHDTYSPKKAFEISPRKNPLARFNLYTDDNELSDFDDSQPTTNSSQDPFDESIDSLPSPCESPVKSRSPSKVSALKAEQTRLKQEKNAKIACKKKFDAEKEQMALDLLLTLDQQITGSKISNMAASTGGIKVIWSKTLRSTAGRANWKRTVSKQSDSPVKGNNDIHSIERQPGVIVQHFASIELAEKIIDRPERLVNTLAHEFCHLANFMVSNIRDQPHGESFKRWGTKTTTWLKSSAAAKHAMCRPEWKMAEVTTKHSYIVETKYLWLCSGRPAVQQKQTLTQKILNIEPEDDEGCGAEYGRHSRSIDTEKQRCGRCKGFLVQVRPAPRAAVASPRKSPVKRGLIKDFSGSSTGRVEILEGLIEGVELSD